MQSRKWMLAGLIPLCLFVAGYCANAGLASGGWHLDWVNGEPSYSAPRHYSFEFYRGLRWSVMLVGGIMTITSYCWKHRKVSLAFGVAAALFNPIIPIHLSKEIWELIDNLVLWVFLVGPAYLWPKPDQSLRI